MWNKIKSYITSHGGDAFPAVTTADNGKVLKVVNGQWVAGLPETSSERYVSQTEYDEMTAYDANVFYYIR